MYLKYISACDKLDRFLDAENFNEILIAAKVCFAITKNLLFSVRYCTIEGTDIWR